MTEPEKISKLWQMVNLAKELAAEKDVRLAGDIQIVLATLYYGLKYIDPANSIENIVAFE